MTKPTALIWVETGTGKGHINSCNSLAVQMVKDGYDVTIVTSDFAGTEEKDKKAGINTVLLPSMEEHLTASEFKNAKENRIKIVEDIFSKINPDVMVIERFPLGLKPIYLDEIKSLVKLAKENTPQTNTYGFVTDYTLVKGHAPKRIVGDNSGLTRTDSTLHRIYDLSKKLLGADNIIKIKNKIMSTTGGIDCYDFIENNYNCGVLKLGDPKLALGPESERVQKMRKSGLIRDIGYLTPENGTQSISYNKDGPIIVTVGGGQSHTGDLLLKNSLQAREFLSEELKQKDMYLFVPPDSKVFEELINKANSLPDNDKIKISRTSPEYKELLPTASIVSTLGGQMTVTELLYLGIPSVACPFDRDIEQKWRVHKFAEEKLTSAIYEKDLTHPRKLANIMNASFALSNETVKAATEFRDCFDAAKKVSDIITYDLSKRLSTEREKKDSIKSNVITQVGNIISSLKNNLDKNKDSGFSIEQ